ncbi:hypothetical protein ACJX0J_035374, partial [Zea mays]
PIVNTHVHFKISSSRWAPHNILAREEDDSCRSVQLMEAYSGNFGLIWIQEAYLINFSIIYHLHSFIN